jgi:Cft2 family RNA processing exonuclease
MFDGVPGFWEQVRKNKKNNYRPTQKYQNHIRSHNTTGNALILYTNKTCKIKAQNFHISSLAITFLILV